MDYVDIQISVDGADAPTNDAVRGEGSFAAARRAMDNLAAAGSGSSRISVVMTRQNVPQLDALAGSAEHYGAQLRLDPAFAHRDAVRTPGAAPSDRRPAARPLPLAHRPARRLDRGLLLHLSALGDPLEGLNLCVAGRVVCLIDPVGDVYACPSSSTTSSSPAACATGRLRRGVGPQPLFEELRSPQSAGACASCGSFDACQGGCMAAKFFTGLPLDGPDPECVLGHGETALAALGCARPTALGADRSLACGPGRLGRKG